MIALLGFECLFNKDRRLIPKLVVWVRDDITPAPNIVLFKMGEVSGENGKLRDNLRKLFREFMEKFPNQPYSNTMHVEMEIAAASGSPFMCQVVKQMDDCWAKNKKRPMQLETHLRFEGKVRARITCFHYQQ
jgi:hypothetical protein